MANSSSAFTGVIANMAAIETEFQANWASLDFMKSARRPNAFIHTNLAAGQTLRLFIRTANAIGGVPIWVQHPDGAATVPAKVTTSGDEWSLFRYFVGQEWSGFVVWASAACTLQVSTTDQP